MEAQNQKRILYVITKSNFGGAQRYVFELAEAMQSAGHRVAVASAHEGLLVDKLKEADIPHFPIHSFQRDLNTKKEFNALSELKSVYKMFDPDIIHLNSSKAGGLGSLAGRLVGINVIVFTAHGWPFLEPRSWLWKTMAYIGSYLTTLLSHKVILVSEHDLHKTFMPLCHRKLQVINTAVTEVKYYDKETAEAKLFSPEEIGIHKNDLWLVTTAELHHNKNIKFALKAVAKHNQTQSTKIYYSIIGEGEEHEELEQLISELDLGNQVKLHGYVDNAKQYLKSFDVSLLPSKKEGFPYTVLEAGHAGLPVIASEVGGVPEIITDQETGLLINPKNVQTLITALANYTNHSEVRLKHATKLQQKIKTDFKLEDMIKKTETIYSSMIDKSGAR